MWALEEQSQGQRRSCLSSLPEKSEELKKNSKHVRRNGAGLRRVTLPKKRAKKNFQKIEEKSSQCHWLAAGMLSA